MRQGRSQFRVALRILGVAVVIPVVGAVVLIRKQDGKTGKVPEEVVPGASTERRLMRGLMLEREEERQQVALQDGQRRRPPGSRCMPQRPSCEPDSAQMTECAPCRRRI